MELDETRCRWRRERTDRKEATRRWDAMAPGFYGRDLPSFADNALLRLIESEGMLGPESRVLETGCGTGETCLALAPRCRSVTGLDISSRMLDYARGEAKRLGLDNVDFAQADWQSEDLNERGWNGAFDLVLAWLTPAVADYDGFAKLCAAGRGWYVLGNHVRRTESLSDRYRAAFGLAPVKTAEEDIIFATAALLRHGKKPRLSYAESEWERSVTFEELYEKYKRRLGVSKPVTPEADARLRAFLERELDGNGVLRERLSATIGIVYWLA